MVTHTWTSMGVDGCMRSVWQKLGSLEQLMATVNDVRENRIHTNLKRISRGTLVDLLEDSQWCLRNADRLHAACPAWPRAGHFVELSEFEISYHEFEISWLKEFGLISISPYKTRGPGSANLLGRTRGG